MYVLVPILSKEEFNSRIQFQNSVSDTNFRELYWFSVRTENYWLYIGKVYAAILAFSAVNLHCEGQNSLPE